MANDDEPTGEPIGEPTGEPTGGPTGGPAGSLQEEPTGGPEYQWVCKEHGVVEPVAGSGGRGFCPKCHKLLAKEPLEEPKEPEGEEGIPPPHVEARRKAIKLLKDRLPNVFGVTGERARAIIDGFEQNPETLDSIQNTWYHIIAMCGSKNLNHYQLNYTLQGIFREAGLFSQVQIPPPPIMSSQSLNQPNPPLLIGTPLPQPWGQPQPPMYAQGVPQAVTPQGHTVPSGGGMSIEQVKRMMDERDKDKELERLRKEVEGKGKVQGGAEAPKELTLEDIERLWDRRDQTKKGKDEKDALVSALVNISKGQDNLNARLSSVEQGGIPTAKASEGETFSSTIMAAAAKDIADRLTGSKEQLTAGKVMEIVSGEVSKHAAPAGTRNQFDMEVEKATHEADARKIEAMEKTKAYSEIARGVKEGLEALGYNIGVGAATGPPQQPQRPAPPPAPVAPRHPGVQGTGTIPPATPQPIEDLGKGMRRTRCPYDDCHHEITFEEGMAQLVCPGCTRVVRVQAAEEQRPPIIMKPTPPPAKPSVTPPAEKPPVSPEKKPPEKPPKTEKPLEEPPREPVEKPPVKKPPEEKPPAPEKK